MNGFLKCAAVPIVLLTATEVFARMILDRRQIEIGGAPSHNFG
jgi:hypothetical protein